ncbi:uncharacterized protein SPAPADRAFT_62696 [Spathaspora passalidarum NRRL Y-27907]|uniref:DFDF domain-containing protein n=1 Tax=Spathaspora passalidarum (strain NRRL Y-27907 / 11-Y1) TaxID=619300 RepID=G3AT66_SPAPN|nr:uncharacterized protein SPAPADRAFT_62696 [Spathaspora passalidarum NRRL Y-27907]EGW30829.1 hypothetical protein SPAPADRAFT_62696 [Spathaspora passalidarum NRRL Y-27907]
MSQYIGKTISLISNKGLRYVGLLDNINAEEATVALNSVRLLGTEGRMAANGTPNLEVPPGNDIYEYVVFRGSDVKDLSVLDTPIDQVKPVPYSASSGTSGYYAPQQMPQTAAPASAPAPSGVEAAPATTTATEEVAESPAAVPASVPHQPVETGAPQHQSPEPTKTIAERATPTTTEESPADPEPRSSPQPTSAKPKPVHRKPHHKGPDIPTEEFDFESANAKFSKELEQERELEHTGYNKKSSFFDNISSSTEERSSMRWAEEKTLNLDTFGEASLQRGRGRGRGRGWRGGFRGGRGRGGRGRGGHWRGGKSENNEGSDYHTKPEWA